MSEKKQEKVILAARQVFMRYGFRRVTMNDLAEAAQMSRPALYLVYSSKEEVFKAVVSRLFQETCEELRQGIVRYDGPKEKLMFAFEVWCVRNYEMIRASPDAKDLLESSYEFAADVMANAGAEFVALVSEVLEPLVRNQNEVVLSSLQIARILAGAAPGFKESVTDAAQLRQCIGDLIDIVLASLRQR